MEIFRRWVDQLPMFLSDTVLPIVQGSAPYTFVTSTLGVGQQRINGLVSDVNSRVAAAYKTPIDGVIITLACCMIITAFIHRIAGLAHWVIFGRLPIAVLGLLLAMAAVWGLFLGISLFHGIILTALVVGGGRFTISHITVHSLIALGVVQLIITIAPMQKLVVSVVGPTAAGERRFEREAKGSDEEVFASPSLNTEDGIYTTEEHIDQIAAAESDVDDDDQSAAITTLLMASNHANGEWRIPTLSLDSTTTTSSSSSAVYRQFISYYDGTVIDGKGASVEQSSSTNIGTAAMDAAWIFSANSLIKNVAIGASTTTSANEDEVARVTKGNARYCYQSPFSQQRRKGALEPILVARATTFFVNVTVECGAFIKRKKSSKSGGGDDDEDSIISPCILIEAYNFVDGEESYLHMPLGLEILVNGAPLKEEEEDGTSGRPKQTALVAFGVFSADGWNAQEDPTYQCLVKRHEPLWHIFVRKWPLTTLILRRGFEWGVFIAGELFEHVGIPAAGVTKQVAKEVGSFSAAVFCGCAEGAGIPPFAFCSGEEIIYKTVAAPAAVLGAGDDQPSDDAEEPTFIKITEKVLIPYVYSRESIAQVIMGPNANLRRIRLACLQQLHDTSAAATEMVMWTGVPMVGRLFADAFAADWAAGKWVFEWTIMPFMSVIMILGEAMVRVIISLFSLTADEGSGVAAGVGSLAQRFVLFLWNTARYNIYPIVQVVTLSVLRAITYAVGVYADTGFNVQVFVALLQTTVVGYNLHLQGQAATASRWSWVSYPYSMGRIAMRNYQSIVVYLGAHLIGGILVMGTTFLPFSGALGLHFLTLNVLFPFASSYALLHFMGMHQNRKATASLLAGRVVLSILIQKGVGDIVGRIVTELTRLIFLAVAIALGALYMGWKGGAPSPGGSPLVRGGGGGGGGGAGGGGDDGSAGNGGGFDDSTTKKDETADSSKEATNAEEAPESQVTPASTAASATPSAAGSGPPDSTLTSSSADNDDGQSSQ